MTPEEIRDSLCFVPGSRDLESSMHAAMAGKSAEFVSPIVAPEGTDLVLLGVHVQQYQPRRSAVNMLDGRDLLDVPEQLGFAVPGLSTAMQNKLARDGSVPVSCMRLCDVFDRTVVTHSAASALAINAKGAGNAIAALDVLNIRPVSEWALSQGKTVVIVPDNSDLSRAAAHAAASALGENVRVAKLPYRPGQRNLMEALIDEQARAAARLMFDPISAAEPWTPGMGRTASMHELAAGVER